MSCLIQVGWQRQGDDARYILAADVGRAPRADSVSTWTLRPHNSIECSEEDESDDRCRLAWEIIVNRHIVPVPAATSAEAAEVGRSR